MGSILLMYQFGDEKVGSRIEIVVPIYSAELILNSPCQCLIDSVAKCKPSPFPLFFPKLKPFFPSCDKISFEIPQPESVI